MFGGFHAWDLIIVLVIALLIFGPKKLPEMGSAIGKSIKEFRKGMNELSNPDIPRKSELSAPKEMHSATRNVEEDPLEALGNLFSGGDENTDPDDPSAMTLVEHLEELRWRIFKSLIAIVVFS